MNLNDREASVSSTDISADNNLTFGVTMLIRLHQSTKDLTFLWDMFGEKVLLIARR